MPCLQRRGPYGHRPLGPPARGVVRPLLPRLRSKRDASYPARRGGSRAGLTRFAPIAPPPHGPGEVVQVSPGLSSNLPAAAPGAWGHTDTFLEGAVEGSLRFVADLDR